MRLVIVLIFASVLVAEESPKPTPEQQIAELQQKVAEQAAELRLYQQGLFACQANEIHAQAKAQAEARAKEKK